MFLGGGRTQAGGSSSSAGPNKVRQFRSGDPMEERDAQKTWESLKKAIHQIHAHNASTLSFEELYRNAYNLVLHKHGALLYNGVQQVVLDHLKEIATDVIRAADEGLLDELKVQWDDHRTVMVMIRDILMYLDRNYVSQYKKIPVYEMGLIAFREQVTAHERVKDRLLKILLDKVNQERNGEQIDRILLKHTLTMLVELGAGGQNVYKTCFEDWFIEDARTFYQHESTKYVSEHTVGEYCKKAEARIREEKQRVQSYLHESTMDKIQSLMDKEWIQRHYETLVSTGARPMFEGDKVEDLERMFRLFVRVPESLKPLHSVLRECIKDAAKAILSDAEKHKEPVSFIDALLKLREKYSTIVRDAFQNSKEFQISLKTSFEETLNGDTSTARYLSLFVDELFRKGMRSVSGQLLDQADTRLDQVVTIFRYLQDKDIFESYYKHHFAKRLLSGKQADDAEKAMISKLKGECGHQYTAKLEGMLNDIKTSEDLTKNFLVAHPPTELGVELRLNILTSGYWPASSAPPSSCEIPPSLKPCLDTFRDFYIQKHQGRRLTWNFSQGTAEVRARLSGNKRHELVVSTYQMVLLTCFNGNENALSYADLLSRTKIPIEDFKRHLQSLYANPKCRLLIKTTAGNPNDPADSGSSGSKREPAEGDTFSVNSEFESKLVRVKVPLIRDADPTRIAQDPGVQEGTDMPASVEEDRKHLTEAVIVRIMKSRLVVEHNQLVVEVTKHLQNRFTPTPALIKQRIERLIEREYLERSEKDRKVYNYLA